MDPKGEPVLARDVPARRDAVRAGPLRAVARGGEEADLAHVAQLVRREQLVECLLWCLAGCEQLEPPVAVATVGERLRRDRAGGHRCIEPWSSGDEWQAHDVDW